MTLRVAVSALREGAPMSVEDIRAAYRREADRCQAVIDAGGTREAVDRMREQRRAALRLYEAITPHGQLGLQLG